MDKEVDSKVRPNQVYAVSLPFPVVQGEKAKLVVSKVLEKLYDTLGYIMETAGKEDVVLLIGAQGMDPASDVLKDILGH